MNEPLEITPPTGPLVGRILPPGSKSITNRALLLAALAQGTSCLTGALKSQDTSHMAKALRAMGVGVEEPDATTFVVTSSGLLRAPKEPLFLGNAGTATRFLTAAAVLADGLVTITGDEHMQQRPIGALLDALKVFGVAVEAPTGCPPVTVHAGQPLQAEKVVIDATLSSQYVSAILMIAPFNAKPLRIELSGDDIGGRGYIDLTLDAMKAFGAQIESQGDTAWLVQPTGYQAKDHAIEPDASAATYLWAAEKLTGGKIEIGLDPEEFTQPDAQAHRVIQQFPNLPSEIEGSQFQDAVPTLAALAAFNQTPVRFTGIANLRVKECDRVAALATELAGLAEGLAQEEGDDLIITPQPVANFRPYCVHTYADHRMAMSLALCGLRVPGVTITDPDCVTKTYPGYWDDLAALGVAIKS